MSGTTGSLVRDEVGTMSIASPSLGVIQAQIRAIRNKVPNAKVFGIQSPSRWTAGSLHGEGDERIAVFQCDSPLEMRLALQEQEHADSTTVLVTPLDQAQVSEDILVRLAMRRLHTINSWEIVRSLFKAKQLDPRITRHGFIADLLLEHAGSREFPPIAGGLVDADTVWNILLTERFGFSGAHPDVVELLRRTAESDFASRWRASEPEFRKAATDWIADAAGETSKAVLRCIEGEYGDNALAIGLVMGVVYDEGVGHTLDKAAGRLEAYVVATNLPQETAKRWRDAASTAATQLSPPALRKSIDEAEGILQKIDAVDHAWRSNELDRGFEQRLSMFGRALGAQVEHPVKALSDELVSTHERVRGHRMGREQSRRMQRVSMAIRLARWLSEQARTGESSSHALIDLSRRYVEHGGFVDWARQVLRGGEPNKELAAALVRVVDRVTEIREAENERFAHALRDEQATSDTASGLIRVESLMGDVVAKAAAIAPVLVLVIDGMSWAVFRELLSDIKTDDWLETRFPEAEAQMIGLAALPSVTEVCRTSLFCGTLKRGQAFDEVQGFASHPDLAAQSQKGFAPRLFHKAALEGDEDSSLASEIRASLSDKRQHIVGIVINAVDDLLDKGDQIDTDWTRQRIRVLDPILSEASLANRIVVLISDHGHVLDRQTEVRDGGDSLRWRRATGTLSSGEIEIRSPRVLIPEPGKVVVPWSERIRYGPKKNGYHGGATPQEMLIPIAMLWSERRLPSGLLDCVPDAPSWWTEPLTAAPAVVAPPRVPAYSKREPTLFDQPAPVAATPVTEAWIRSLFDSPGFAAQKRLVGRVRIEDAVIERLLSALASRGGSMTAPALAGAIGLPEQRLSGLMALVQRILNVEGYPVLDRQDAAKTVVLNIALLKKQFELE